eukprot:GHVT01061095.1.p1 GENE.GHVT01061095.1~~GHVT01061095.1.p1  ORF type:complete len:459 (-),score=83.07 GHVT01061095.1:781-2157(-)
MRQPLGMRNSLGLGSLSTLSIILVLIQSLATFWLKDLRYQQRALNAKTPSVVFGAALLIATTLAAFLLRWGAIMLTSSSGAGSASVSGSSSFGSSEGFSYALPIFLGCTVAVLSLPLSLILAYASAGRAWGDAWPPCGFAARVLVVGNTDVLRRTINRCLYGINPVENKKRPKQSLVLLLAHLNYPWTLQMRYLVPWLSLYVSTSSIAEASGTASVFFSINAPSVGLLVLATLAVLIPVWKPDVVIWMTLPPSCHWTLTDCPTKYRLLVKHRSSSLPLFFFSSWLPVNWLLPDKTWRQCKAALPPHAHSYRPAVVAADAWQALAAVSHECKALNARRNQPRQHQQPQPQQQQLQQQPQHEYDGIEYGVHDMAEAVDGLHADARLRPRPRRFVHCPATACQARGPRRALGAGGTWRIGEDGAHVDHRVEGVLDELLAKPIPAHLRCESFPPALPPAPRN